MSLLGSSQNDRGATIRPLVLPQLAMRRPAGANLTPLGARKEGSEECLEGLEPRPRVDSEADARSLWYLGQVKTRLIAVRNLLRLYTWDRVPSL
jgi:hypothetical protein